MRLFLLLGVARPEEGVMGYPSDGGKIRPGSN